MNNSVPAKEAPVTLRATSELSAKLLAKEVAEASVAASMARAPSGAERAMAGVETDGVDWLTASTLATSGAVVLAGAGWLMLRRHRLVPRVEVNADGMRFQPLQVDVASAQAPVDALTSTVLQARDPDEEAQTTVSPGREQPDRHASLIGVAGQKRLIQTLMWLRAITGAAAILAAIAIVVFWSIESTDLRAGDTGLTVPLLVLLLVGWASSWCAGHLANLLHRSFFGRVHPKFDT